MSLTIAVVKQMIQGQLRWFLILLFHYIGILVILNYLDLFDECRLTMNMTSITSHCFIVFTILLMGNILELGTRYDSSDGNVSSEWEAKERQIQRMTAVVLFPTFPLIMTGKLVYAWMLLSIEGQEKCAPFFQFEETLWESRCRDQNGLISICGAGLFLKHDLALTTTFVCVPVSITILYIRWRYLSTYLSCRIGDSKLL